MTGVGAIEQAMSTAELGTYAFETLSLWGSKRLTAMCGPGVPVFLSYDDNDANSVISAGDVVRASHASCFDSSRQIAITVSVAELPARRLEGHAELTVESDFGVRLTGSFDLVMAPESSGTRWSIANLSLTRATSSGSDSITAASTERTVAVPGNAYRVTMAGVVESERIGGSFNIATVTPLSGTLGNFPSTGELRMTAGASRVRIVPAIPAGPELAYAVDATGSGQYAEAKRAHWLATLGGLIFGVAPNMRPRITNFTLLPASPNAGDTLQASYTVLDLDGPTQNTTFEWRRNGELLAGETAATLAPGRHRRGDTIEVTALIDDGIVAVNATATASIVNAPPRLSSTVISPNPAYTLDDLKFGTVTDADGDALQVRYEWRRNGSLLSSYTAATLPASEHQKGDVIDVAFSANDGLVTTTAQASITIQDSLPRLSAPAPTTVGRGGAVSFTVRISDDDGDSVAHLLPVLAHGPSGMTLDARTGAVTWVADLPMFDRTLDVNWRIAVNDASVQARSGTIRVEDPARLYPVARGARGAPLWPSGLEVGDFDGDGDVEMLILSSDSLYELERDGAGGYRQAWRYPFAFRATPESIGPFQRSGRSIAVGDVDHDGKAEIFVATEASIAKLDGVHRRVVAGVDLNMSGMCTDLQYADLANDGAGEVVCLSSQYVFVLSAADLALRWTFPLSDYGQTLAIANVDSDPALEIIAERGYVFDGATYATDWRYISPGPNNFGFGYDVDAGDFDGDGVAEIFALDSGVSGIAAYSARSRQRLWTQFISMNLGSQSSLHVANIEGDARVEVLAGDYNWGFGAFRYNALSRFEEIFRLPLQLNQWVGAIGVGDVDADGAVEFVFGGTSIAGRNPGIAIEQLVSDSWGMSPFVGGEAARRPLSPTVAMFATPSNVGSRWLALDPVSGNLRVGPALGENYNFKIASTVADWDNDGTDEAFLSDSADRAGFYSVHDPFVVGAPEWASPLLASGVYGVAVTKADLTGDGRAELIGMTTEGSVEVYDVYQQSLFWRGPSLGTGVDVAVANLDGTGALEIIAVAGGGITVYSQAANPPTIAERYQQTDAYVPPAGRVVSDAVIGDVDGDGALDVVALVMPEPFHEYTSQIVRLDRDLVMHESFGLDWRPRMLALEPGSPQRNVVVPRGDLGTSRLIALDARSGAEVWRSPVMPTDVAPNSVQFIDAGGVRRISVGGAGAMIVTR